MPFLLLFCLSSAPALALDGTVVVTTGLMNTTGDVAVIDVQTGATDVLTSGGGAYGPCFSPDGTEIAFWRNGEILTMALDGSNVTPVCDTFASAFEQQAMTWTQDDTIYWSGYSPRLYRVQLGGGNGSREVVHTLADAVHEVRRFSVSRDGLRAAYTRPADGDWRVRGIDLVSHAEVDFGQACNGTVSPDGTLVAHNLRDHVQARIRNFADQSIYTTIDIAPGRQEFGNHRFSHSSNDHIVYTADYAFAYVCNIHTNQSTLVGSGIPWDYRPTPPDFPELTALDVEAHADTLLPGTAVTLTTRAWDQDGDPFATPITWSVSGGGAVSPAASPGAVTTHSSTFVSDGESGTFTVVARSDGVTGTAALTVVSLSLPLRINTGDNQHDVQGWLRDDLFVSGGADRIHPSPADTTGVQDAAPAPVYRSVRHGLSHALSVPVPDGTYVVRLHFASPSFGTSMDYRIGATQVLSGFDVAAEAGGVNRALVRDFAVTVSGGDGIEIVAESTTDAFEAGVELLDPSAVNQAPSVDAGLDRVTDTATPVYLDGTVTDDGLPAGALSVVWSQLSGPGTVLLDDSGVEGTFAHFDQAGDYVLELSASDGSLTTTDEVRITVEETEDPPSIIILSPQPGDIWIAGSTQTIRWSTVNLADVAIRYSTDDGVWWRPITESIGVTDDDWGALPWSVPDEPSELCLIAIEGYGDGEGRTILDRPFAIIAGHADDQPAEADTLVGGSFGCGAGAGAATPSGTALVVIVLLRRRKVAGFTISQTSSRPSPTR